MSGEECKKESYHYIFQTGTSIHMQMPVNPVGLKHYSAMFRVDIVTGYTADSSHVTGVFCK